MMLGLWCGEWLKSARATTDEAEGTARRGRRARADRPRAAVAAHQPDREADLDLVLHAVQRRPGDPDAGGFYAAIEIKGWRRWSFPLLVIGANSIAVYVMSWTMEDWVKEAWVRHLGAAPFAIFGPPFEPVLKGLAVLVVFWSILFWMYRRRFFVRI